MSSGCKYLLRLFNGDELLLAAHIRSESDGHIDAAVGVQVVLKEGDKHSRGRDDGVVERVGKVFAVFAVHPDLQPAGLSVAEVGAGADLKVFLLPG